MVISIDTDQVGRYAVEALEEFYQMGHVSSYYSVGLNVVTKENVQEFCLSRMQRIRNEKKENVKLVSGIVHPDEAFDDLCPDGGSDVCDQYYSVQ